MVTGNLLVISSLIISSCFADELLMVHMVSRHGDRAPSSTFKNDLYNESSWYQGYGELTLNGVARSTRLGKLIKRMYAEDLKFLDENYRSHEIYIRSTDHNRTILSAMSNLIGMYYNNKTRVGVDYPDDADWPQHFIPIPVHTVQENADYMLNPTSLCNRLLWLWSNVRNTPEYLKLKNDSEGLIANLSKLIGEEATFDNIWAPYDVFYNELLENRSTVIDKDSFVKMELVKKLAIDNMADGLNISDYDGINLRMELAKLRGGGLLWNIINHMDQKLDCINVSNKERAECKWIYPLKYYAYSGHDTTVSALLTALDAKQRIIAVGPPFYGAAVAIELWRLDDGNAAVKMKFYQEDDIIEGIRTYPGTGGVFSEVTFAIGGCEVLNGYCLYDNFRKRSEQYYPGSQEVLCKDVVSKQTNMWPTQAPSSSTFGLTTTSGNDRAFNQDFCFLLFLLCLYSENLQI